MSQKNQFKFKSYRAKRGSIFDRNGNVLAYDAIEYNLKYTPSSSKALFNFINSLNIVNDIQKVDLTMPHTWPLSKLQLIKIMSHIHKHPNLSLEQTRKRRYVHGKETAHLIGLYGRNTTSDLKNYPYYERAARTQIGKSGIEKDLESILSGRPGVTSLNINAKGKVLSQENMMPPRPGKDVTLTIDINLQKAALDALNNQKGALVAIEPLSGDILAIVSSPSYDPELFYNPKKSRQLRRMITDNNQPMFNRSINGLYAPASTIKPFIGLGGLHSKAITASEKIYDPGYFFIPGSSHKFNNWLPSGQGYVDIVKAIQVSCDTYFYHLAYKMGIEKIHDTLIAFGFGQSTGTFPNESSGFVPHPDTKKNQWHQGNTVITGIGQGQLLITPLQLAQAVATLSMQGEFVTPRLISGYGSLGSITEPKATQHKESIIMSKNHWKVIAKGMRRALSQNGTGKHFSDFPIPISGKTGTAQLVKIDRTRALPDNLKDNSLLIAYAPSDKPQIAISLVVENEHNATIVAKKFLNYWHDNIYSKHTHLHQSHNHLQLG